MISFKSALVFEATSAAFVGSDPRLISVTVLSRVESEAAVGDSEFDILLGFWLKKNSAVGTICIYRSHEKTSQNVYPSNI